MNKTILTTLSFLVLLSSCSPVFQTQKVNKTETLVSVPSKKVETKIPVKKIIVGVDTVDYNDEDSYRFGVFPGVETLVVGKLDVVSLDKAEVIEAPPPSSPPSPPQAKRIPLQIMYSSGSNETPKEPEKKIVEKKIEVFFNFNKSVLTKDQMERFLSEVREFKKDHKEVNAEVYGYSH